MLACAADISTHLEFSVVLIEAVLLLGFAIPLWARRVNQFPPGKEALLVHVVAQQFSFNYHLPGADGQFARRDVNLVSNSNPLGIDPKDPAGKDDIVTTGELHVPVDRPVIAELSSKDVIHDYFIPDMRIAGDAIPGSLIPIWFTPVKTGTYEVICAPVVWAWPLRNERHTGRRYAAGLPGVAERTRRACRHANNSARARAAPAGRTDWRSRTRHNSAARRAQASKCRRARRRCFAAPCTTAAQRACTCGFAESWR